MFQLLSTLQYIIHSIFILIFTLGDGVFNLHFMDVETSFPRLSKYS